MHAFILYILIKCLRACRKKLLLLVPNNSVSVKFQLYKIMTLTERRTWVGCDCHFSPQTNYRISEKQKYE